MQSPATLISHLRELRDRVLRMVLGFAFAFVCLFPFANQIYALLAQPLLTSLPAGGHMIATAVISPFLVPIKMAMLAALVVSLPWTL